MTPAIEGFASILRCGLPLFTELPRAVMYSEAQCPTQRAAVRFHRGLLCRPELHDCLHGTPRKETKPHKRFLGLFSPFQGRQDLRSVQGAVKNRPSVVYRYKLT